MNVKKLLSENVGEYHPEQTLILTEKGELFVTKNELTVHGYELVKFQSYDLQQLTTMVNNALKGKPLASFAEVEIENNTIHVSPISNLFMVVNYENTSFLDTIIGGREAQQISILGDGNALQIKRTGNLKLIDDMTIQNEFSLLLLQKVDSIWVEVSRKHNI
jgi:hypothetical protein